MEQKMVGIEVDENLYNLYIDESKRLSNISNRKVTPEMIVELVVKFYPNDVVEIDNILEMS